MKLTIKTVSPVHVGNGEELYALDYVVDGQHYYRISQKQFEGFLEQINNGLDRYSDWIVKSAERIEQLEKGSRGRRDYNQELNYQRGRFNLLGFAEEINEKGAFLKFLNEKASLKVPFRGKLRGQVRAQLKDGLQRPYLPGTSVKGAIRTALLYCYLCDFGDQEWLIRYLKEFVVNTQRFDHRGRKRAAKTLADGIEQAAFYCPKIDQFNNFRGKEEQFDIMKFLTISDAIPEKEDSLGLFNINLYLVDKQHNPRTKSTTLVATEQPQAPYVEGFKSDQKFTSNVDFNIDFLLRIKHKLTTDGITINGEKVWKDLGKKVKQVFNLELPDVVNSTKEEYDKIVKEYKTKVLQHIANCVRRFGEAQQKADDKWLDHFVDNDRHNFTDKINKGFEHLEAHKGHFLMRMGYATGFNGTTDVLYLLNNEKLKAAYKEVMELLLIGDRPGAAKQRQYFARKHNRPEENYKANPDRFPKSRRFARSKEAITPLGWVALEWNGMPAVTKVDAAEKEEVKATPQFYTEKINYKKTPILDAVVEKSGFPNKVKVYILDEASSPVLPLLAYRAKLEVGSFIKVAVSVNKKGKVLSVSFKSMA